MLRRRKDGVSPDHLRDHGGRHRWLSENPGDERAAHVRKELADQLREYVTVYRGVLGFCYLVLAR